ncbi:MAG TPA: NAD/NADP octopine/nopaline dehydrogenase family protein [Gemmataceae bacterium]|nr:NAD/NADP octopine/nopaline dehydrogenase family protein [Gemmataceae bacterium]
MSVSSLTILGGGNTAFAVAANLTLAGFQVTLCELPAFRHTVQPLLGTGQITLDGVAYRDTARVHAVTTDFADALAVNDLVLLIVPAYAHKPFAEACAPHLHRGHTVVLTPGTLGSLEFARVVRERRGPELFAGSNGLVIAETDTAPYVCRKTGPASAHIWGVVTGLGVGVFPAARTETVCGRLEELFAGVRPHPSVLASGLAAMNPVVHPAGVLLNAGRIERSRGDFYFYEEGVTPAVCHLIYAVDRERRAIAAALGLDLLPVDEAFHRAGFGPQGDLWATINGSRMLTPLRAPGSLEGRWLSEDVPYGLGAWASLAEQLGVAAPTLRSLIQLLSAAVGIDFWKAARTTKELGIAGMSREELLRYVEAGSTAAAPEAAPRRP